MLGKDPPDRRGVLDIIRDDAGADRQVDHFRLRRLEGDSESEALRSVVDLVVAETKEAGPRRDTPVPVILVVDEKRRDGKNPRPLMRPAVPGWT